MFNAVTADLVSDANSARPISAGGTGATNVDDALTALGLNGLVDVTEATASNALDSLSTLGTVFVASANCVTVNGPTGGGDGFVSTGYTSTLRFQVFNPVSATLAPWRRVYTASAWTAWLQDVTYTTHATNGESDRFRSGLQICQRNRLVLTQVSTTACTGTWTLPAAFVNNDYSVGCTLRPTADNGTVTNFASGAASTGETSIGALAVSKSTTAVTVAVFRQSGTNDFQNGDEMYVDLTATGRWF
jgi:hypothetical protein